MLCITWCDLLFIDDSLYSQTLFTTIMIQRSFDAINEWIKKSRAADMVVKTPNSSNSTTNHVDFRISFILPEIMPHDGEYWTKLIASRLIEFQIVTSPTNLVFISSSKEFNNQVSELFPGCETMSKSILQTNSFSSSPQSNPRDEKIRLLISKTQLCFLTPHSSHLPLLQETFGQTPSSLPEWSSVFQTTLFMTTTWDITSAKVFQIFPRLMVLPFYHSQNFDMRFGDERMWPSVIWKTELISKGVVLADLGK